jgi:hypothetical protein
VWKVLVLIATVEPGNAEAEAPDAWADKTWKWGPWWPELLADARKWAVT